MLKDTVACFPLIVIVFAMLLMDMLLLRKSLALLSLVVILLLDLEIGSLINYSVELY